MNPRPNVLTIAGFDPSGGAGLLADVKTLEQIKCYGLAVCTANTIQNDKVVTECHWTPFRQLRAQLELTLTSFEVDVVKIGLVEDWNVLDQLLEILHTYTKDIRIVWDPVWRSSSGFDFHDNDKKVLDTILEKVYVITPNYEEVQQLYKTNVEEAVQRLTQKTSVLLKGGHNEAALGTDLLYTQDGKQYQFKPKGSGFSEKHGSGCILSSAIAGYLALGFSLTKACFRAKRYTGNVLRSNKSLLGYHR